MVDTPYKLRIRRVREDVIIDLMLPLARGRFTVVESINAGPVTLRAAIEGLQTSDLSQAPRMAAVLIPGIT